MSFLKLLFAFFMLFFLFSCSGDKDKNTKKHPVKYENLKTGVVFDSVKIDAGKQMSYALYLPGSYKPEEKSRAVIFFDPHAKGNLPVKKYKDLAEKYSVVLAGSNDSKNGQSAGERNDIITKFLFDVEQRVNIDKSRLVTGGFSGGARIASLIAIYNSNVSGIIGCGGGFPAVRKLNNTNFTWVGIVGNRDFNFLEMKNLYSQLKTNGFKAFLLVFDGKHEWPPAEVTDEAFGILFLNRTENLKYEIKDGLKVTSWDKKEVELQKMLVSNFEAKDLNWWKKEIRLMEDKSKNAETEDEQLMYSRLLSYMGIISYTFTNSAITKHQLDEAWKYLEIYQAVEPENPDMFFFKAVCYWYKDDKDKAKLMLQNALENGFDDFSKLKSVKGLDSLLNE